jgi:hypothetical protein
VRVVFLIIDALPARHVGSDTTPVLASLAAEGAFAVGRAVMTSATYPNHATFATGAEPDRHRLLANWVVTERGPQPAQRVGPAVATLFDVAPSSAAVVGDHNLIAVMGADRADAHWPPRGVLPDGVRRDAHGYAADDEVLPRLLPFLAAGGPDLVVGHLNEPDTAAHVHGPDSDAALLCFRATDARLQEVIDTLRSAWDDVVLIVVSDHDQETATTEVGIEIWPSAESHGLLGIPEGNGAVVWGDDPERGLWLDELDGVAGHAEAWPGARVVWAQPGRWFAVPPGIEHPFEPGQHGGATTRAQVTVVAGGHPAVRTIAASLAARRPEAADWGPTIASLLALDLADATGRSLA